MRVYDINVDQLKCNFCTQWFRCSYQFACLQRYSLNTCPKCLSRFPMSLLDPRTYRLYRLILLDAGLNLAPNTELPACSNPPPALTALHDDASDLKAQIDSLISDLRARLAEQYEAKLQELMNQWRAANESLSQYSSNIVAIYNELVSQLERETPVEPDEWLPDESWMQRMNRQLEKVKGLHKRDANRRRKGSYQNDKENIQPQQENILKSLRTKVMGDHDLKIISPRQGRIALAESRWANKSAVGKRDKLRKSGSRVTLGESKGRQPSEGSREQIMRLLGESEEGQSYMEGKVSRPQMILEKQGNRNMAELILELKGRTQLGPELVELIGGPRINFECYLRSLQSQNPKVLRVIRCGLVDWDFDALLRWLSRHPVVQVLIVTNNRLTELSLQGLLRFMERHPQSHLTHAYFGNNFMRPSRAATTVKALKERGIYLSI